MIFLPLLKRRKRNAPKQAWQSLEDCLALDRDEKKEKYLPGKTSALESKLQLVVMLSRRRRISVLRCFAPLSMTGQNFVSKALAAFF